MKCGPTAVICDSPTTVICDSRTYCRCDEQSRAFCFRRRGHGVKAYVAKACALEPCAHLRLAEPEPDMSHLLSELFAVVRQQIDHEQPSSRLDHAHDVAEDV